VKAPVASALAGKKRFPGISRNSRAQGTDRPVAQYARPRARRSAPKSSAAQAMATILEPLLIVAMGGRDVDRLPFPAHHPLNTRVSASSDERGV
jgi:hypothetical protein